MERRSISEARKRRQRQIRRRIVMFAVGTGMTAGMILLAIVLFHRPGGERGFYLTEECESYRSEVEETAKKHGMTPYVDLIMAVMMQESGGRSLDVMQCAEGVVNTLYPHEPNGITDPSYSIDCGIQELKYALEKAECSGPDDIGKIKIALQGYNFGIDGFLDFLQEKGDVRWTEEYAAGYAMLASGGIKREGSDVESMGLWAYGDQYYPLHVLRYYERAQMQDE